MEFQKAEKNSYRGEHSKQLKEARAGIQAAVKVLEQVEILSLEFFFENSVAWVHSRILHCTANLDKDVISGSKVLLQIRRIMPQEKKIQDVVKFYQFI